MGAAVDHRLLYKKVNSRLYPLALLLHSTLYEFGCFGIYSIDLWKTSHFVHSRHFVSLQMHWSRRQTTCRCGRRLFKYPKMTPLKRNQLAVSFSSESTVKKYILSNHVMPHDTPERTWDHESPPPTISHLNDRRQ
eukprot:NODE_577_length_5827_cov_0.545740.p5 type:complete len:135 gc:universal NODE_577_length_5827_cov_0.545740:2159-2563(+)